MALLLLAFVFAAPLAPGGPLLLLLVFILARKCGCGAPRWLKLWCLGTAPPPLPILMREWRWEWWRLTETPGLSGITCCWSGVEEEEEEEDGMEVEEVGLLEEEEEEEEDEEVF